MKESCENKLKLLSMNDKFANAENGNANNCRANDSNASIEMMKR